MHPPPVNLTLNAMATVPLKACTTKIDTSRGLERCCSKAALPTITSGKEMVDMFDDARSVQLYTFKSLHDLPGQLLIDQFCAGW
jgi:hypothetical protein